MGSPPFGAQSTPPNHPAGLLLASSWPLAGLLLASSWLLAGFFPASPPEHPARKSGFKKGPQTGEFSSCKCLFFNGFGVSWGPPHLRRLPGLLLASCWRLAGLLLASSWLAGLPARARRQSSPLKHPARPSRPSTPPELASCWPSCWALAGLFLACCWLLPGLLLASLSEHPARKSVFQKALKTGEFSSCKYLFFTGLGVSWGPPLIWGLFLASCCPLAGLLLSSSWPLAGLLASC